MIVTIVSLLLAVVALVGVIVILSRPDGNSGNTPGQIQGDNNSNTGDADSKQPDPAGNGSDNAQNGTSGNTSADTDNRADNSGNDPADNGPDNGQEGSGSGNGTDNGNFE